MTTFIETLNHSGDQFLKFAWSMLWQSSLLIAVIFVLEFALRRKVRAAIRYALWLMVLVKLLLPPSLALPTSPSWWIHPAVPPPVKAPPVSFTVSYGEQIAPDFPLPPSPVIPPPKAPAMSFAAWALAASGVVSAGLLAWLLVRWRQINQKVRRANTSEKLIPVLDETRRLTRLHPGIRLKLTEDSMSPAVCGLFRPVILLPRSLVERLSEGQLRAVLLHEAIHLRRGDVWMNCAQALLQIVYWWHPLLWLANARIRRVREEAVDDAVMLALRDDAEIYAPTLLEVAKLAFNRPLASLGLVGILESRSALRQRIERLVNFNAPKKAGLTVVSILGILAFSAVALPMGEAPEKTNAPTVSVSNSTIDTNAPGKVFKAGTGANTVTGLLSDTNFLTVLHALEQRTGTGTVAEPEPVTTGGRQVQQMSANYVFAQNAPAVEKNGNSEKLEARMFKVPRVATGTIGKKVTHIDFANTNLTTAEVDAFLKAIGVNLAGPGRSVLFNGRLSLLFVKATETELGQVEYFVRTLNRLASAESLAEPEPVIPAEQGADRINRMFVPDKINIPTITTNATESAMLVQDGKLLYEMGKFDEAETNFNQALKLDPDNQAAFYYLSLVTQAKWAPNVGVGLPVLNHYATNRLGALTPPRALFVGLPVPNPYATNTGVHTSPGREAISNKLNSIRLESVSWGNGISLDKAIRFLVEQSRLRDLDKTGINFLFNPNMEESNNATMLDPSSISVKLERKDVSLRDLLDAVVRGADHPVKYTVEDYAVVISPKPPGPEPPKLEIRVFKIDTKRFTAGFLMQHIQGKPDLFVKSLGMQTNSIPAIATSFFSAIGVNLTAPGRSIAFNDKLGLLFVKATPSELDAVERVIQTLYQVAPQIHIKARFIEVPKDGFVMPTTLSNNVAGQMTGILSDPELRTVLQALEHRQGVETFAEPEAVTTSGRQTQMWVTDTNEIVTNFAFQVSSSNSTVVVAQSGKFEIGPMVDLVPHVLDDGYTINLTAIASMREFLGYDSATNRIYTTNNIGRRISAPTVRPGFLVHERLATVNLWDGQTLVLGNLKSQFVGANGEIQNESKFLQDAEKKNGTADKELFVFITAWIVDPAGNRVHSDDEMRQIQARTKSYAPPQPNISSPSP